MRKCLFAASCIAIASLANSCKVQQHNNVKKSKSLVVLYDNDVHCNIEGYAKIAGLRNAIADTADVLLVSCGDFLQGGRISTISKGQYVVDVMKKANYDIVTLGNHEFDFGADHMFALLKDLNAPITCVNFKDHKTGKNIYAPYFIKQAGNKKIAFVGVTTPTAITSERYAFFDERGQQIYNMSENEVYALVQKTVDEVRAKGANYVVVLSHLGEEPTEYNVDSRGLIANTTGIDVLLDGHTHATIEKETLKNKEGKAVLTSQTGTKFANIGKLTLSPDGRFSTEFVSAQNVKEDAKVRQAVDSINGLADAYFNTLVGKCDFGINITGENGKRAVRIAETNAGDIIADAFREIAGTDIGMTDGGSVRADIKPGDIRIKDVIDVLPYDNAVYEIEVDGKQIETTLNACIQKLPLEDGEFPQVSGLTFNIRLGKDGNKVSDIKILNKKTGNYEPIDYNAHYTIATIDYIVTGGGMYNTLKDSKILRKDIIIDKDALIQYISKNMNGKVRAEYAKPQGRINIVPLSCSYKRRLPHGQ